MSGIGPSPAEQHLGDRLAALVDGELGHDERERVLAHLATCPKCKTEADCQRRLKSVFAEAAPPPPSAGFLARLQGLPGGPPRDDDDDDRGPFGLGRAGFAGQRPDARLPGPGGFSFSPAGATAAVFPVHEVGRPDAERSVRRGRRFAFAAASAVSLAAMALGGAIPSSTSADAPLGRGAGNNVVPARAPSNSTAAEEAGRRHGRSSRAGARHSPASGTLQVLDLSAHMFATPSLVVSPSPSLPVLPFAAAFSAEVLNGAVGAPLVEPTGSAPPGAAAAVPSASPGPGAGVGATPLPGAAR